MVTPEANRNLPPSLESKGVLISVDRNAPSGASAPGIDPAMDSPLLELVNPGQSSSVETLVTDRADGTHEVLSQRIFSPRAYFDALAECATAIRSSILGAWDALPGGSFTKAAIVGSVGSLLSVFAAMAPAQAVGIAAGIVVIHGLTYRDNHLIRAQSSVGQALFAVHLALLGAWPAATQSTLSAIRPIFLSMVPEDSSTVRTVGGIVGFGVVGTFFSYAMLVEPLFQLRNLPLCVMALSTLAEALPRKLSWGSRLSLFACATSLVPYHALISHSWMGIGINLLSIGALAKSIMKHDLLGKESQE